MPSYRTGTVEQVISERPGLQRVMVDGHRAYVLTQLIGTVAIGDDVVCNTTAVELGLGSGGWHVVHWNLSRREWSQPGPGHIMKLRYSSLQADTGCAEELDGYVEPDDLQLTPVVCILLHSQLVPVIAGIRSVDAAMPVAYVQTDSAALPLALSDSVARLKELGWLHHTVTAGQAFGGDYESVSFASGVVGAFGRTGSGIIIAGPGIGVVGTGTKYGFGGADTAAMISTVDALQGTPIHALRYSNADLRDRHRGVSHHSQTVEVLSQHVSHTARPSDVPIDFAEPVEVPDIEAFVVGTGLELRSMGRTYAEDPDFFRVAAAAGIYAADTAATPLL